MKAFTIFVIVIIGASITFTTAADNLKCEHPQPQIPKDWLDMVEPCVKAMRDQIKRELHASMQYLSMGAHFNRDVINRPGFAKMFFDAASEERQHAIKLISYLLMRGELTKSVSDLISRNIDVEKTEWSSGVAALEDALRLETSVTKSIKGLIKTCEESYKNDYHLVDYLTGEFLEEQYKGQRDLAGKISTLDKLKEHHGALGEFLFDKKLLNGEI